nr:MAG TPA: hypothetical protein [Caudoviricetes sp.]
MQLERHYLKIIAHQIINLNTILMEYREIIILLGLHRYDLNIFLIEKRNFLRNMASLNRA